MTVNYDFVSIIFSIIFPFIIGSIFYRNSCFSSYSWLTGVMVIAYSIMLTNGLHFKKDYLYFILFLLSIFGLFNITSNISFKKKQIISLTFFKSDNVIFQTYSLFLLLILITVTFESILEVIRAPVLGGDALAYWYQKAKAFDLWLEFIEFPTVSYPSFGSAIWAYAMFFYNIEYFGRLFFIIIYLIFCFNFFKKIRSDFIISQNYLYFLYLVMASYFIFGITEEFASGLRFLSSGYMDWLVALLNSFAYYSIITALPLQEKNKKISLSTKSLFFPFFVMGCSGLVKDEGFVFTLIILLSIFIVVWAYNVKILLQNIYKFILLYTFTIIISLSYKILLFINGLSIANEQGFSIELALKNYLRIYDLVHLSKMLEYFVYQILYNYEIIIPTILILAYSLKNKCVKPVVIFILPLIMIFLFFFLVFLITNYEIEFHLATALSRLFYFPLNLLMFGGVYILSYNFSKYFKVN